MNSKTYALVAVAALAVVAVVLFNRDSEVLESPDEVMPILEKSAYEQATSEKPVELADVGSGSPLREGSASSSLPQISEQQGGAEVDAATPRQRPAVIKMSVAEVEVELAFLRDELTKHVSGLHSGLDWISTDVLSPGEPAPENTEQWQVFHRSGGEGESGSFAIAQRVDHPEYFADLDRIDALYQHPTLVNQRETARAVTNYEADAGATQFTMTEEQMQALEKTSEGK
jgi:hypothetical protein